MRFAAGQLRLKNTQNMGNTAFPRQQWLRDCTSLFRLYAHSCAMNMEVAKASEAFAPICRTIFCHITEANAQ
jgi:hypothetical protein